MKKNYQFMDDLTSDVMFEAFGKTLEEVFEASAEGMFSVICDIDKIKPEESLTIEVSAEDEKTLLYEFLSTLLTESEIKGLFLSRFRMKTERKNNQLIMRGNAFGEKMSPEKGGTVVKGVTYYGFKLEKTENGYRAQVAMDI
ncbi:MAG: archease [Spirochaetales bacterium]|nr:archease [Spirochaetales bacterium]